MSLLNSISVRVPDEKEIPQIVDIHRSELAYTLNSQMGSSHLAALYLTMLESPDCWVLAAFDENFPVGLVSGSLDMEKVKTEILRNFSAVNWMNLLFRFIRNPLLIQEWRRGVLIGKPVRTLGQPVNAILTTIAVRKDHQRMGIGERLIQALEDEFLRRGVDIYRLDTTLANTGSRAFYKRLGFRELEQRSDSVVLIKRIETS